jgi:dolichol-phosphate mannosyltransferase
MVTDSVISVPQTKAPCDQKVIDLDFEPALSIIVPTKNESGNVNALLQRIDQVMRGNLTEVVFVDDSSDDTPEVICNSAGKFPNLVINLLHRPPEMRQGGLGGAVIEGFKIAHAPFACVMDGDLQHPPEIIPQLYEMLEKGNADLAIATRRAVESDESGLGTMRAFISRGLDLIARIFFPRQLHGVSDPLTGFFMLRLSAIDLEAMHPQGFKILLEILVRNPNLKKAEIPFNFGARFAGKSKASTREAFKYLDLLWNLRFGAASLRFLKFVFVGASGIVVNSLVMLLFTELFNVYYMVSAVLATIGSTTWNFVLTEFWVFSAGSRANGRLKRYVLFFIMNNIALLFRSPIIYILTSLFGVYYLMSNFISLVILTVLRYLLADGWIWGKPRTDELQSSGNPVTAPQIK